MATISQNADGTYNKSYSDIELTLVKALVDEAHARQLADQALWVDVTGLSNRVGVLEDEKTDMTFVQNEVIKAMGLIAQNRDDINRLDALLGVDAYSKEEVMQLISLWRVEQISHVFTQPTASIFDKINIDDLKTGYKGYLMANIYEPHDNHIPENTMQRYTINAFVETPRQVTFRVSFADRCTFVLNGIEKGIWADTSGNFGGVPKLLVLDFKEGWNEIQIMIANETQRGGLIVESDLFEKADYLSNLDDFTGMITGNRIAPGSIDETHLSPNMDLIVNTLHATAEDIPAVVVGNPEGCGILQIGDKTISKCINEPFVFDDGIRVNGYIYVSQLLIDKDFIIEGDGIFIEKQIDVTTGFTDAYIIHNDMVINNGGGLTIVGDARKGYTITNAMKLIADGDLNGWLPPNPELSPSGIEISGDAVKGYYIRNSMMLTVEGTGGLLVTGNGHDGYFIKNIMNLSTAKGLEVVGNPWEAAGYKLRNKMTLTGAGVILTPSIDDQSYWNWHIENDTKIEVGLGLNVQKIDAGHFKLWNIMQMTGDRIIVQPTGNLSDGYSKWHLINDTLLTTTCGGIKVNKEANGHWSISNNMSLGFTPGGPVNGITGDACTGYIISSRWPTINPGQGIGVNDNGNGVYTISNLGVLSVGASGGAQLQGSPQHPIIYVPPVNLSMTSPDGSIMITGGGNNWQFMLNPDAIPEVEMPEIPPSVVPAHASVSSQGHGTEANGGFRKVGPSATSMNMGIGKGDITFNSATRVRIKLDVAISSAVSGVTPKVYARVYPEGSASTAGTPLKEFSTNFSTGAVGYTNYVSIVVEVNKSQIPGTPNGVVVGVFVDASVVNQTEFWFKITSAEPLYS